jgi:N-acetylmuramoyl-L-alanine amidase
MIFYTRLLLMVFSALTLSSEVNSAYALDINDIRFGVHPDKTRIVIEMDQATKFRAFMLPEIEGKPYRLVVDLPNFNWKAGAVDRPAKTTILGVRDGQLNATTQRVVVDLSQPAKIKDGFLIPSKNGQPNRLVVDFQNISVSAFANTKHKPFGTLPETSGDLNLLFTRKQISSEQFSGQQNPVILNSPTIKQISNQTPNNNTISIITPQRKPSYTPSSPAVSLYRPLIVIDAGHGGQDPGAIGAENQREKNVTLSTSKIIKRHLEATGRYRVHLTRDNDRYIRLSKRVGIARTKDADLFISIHADSINKPDVRGASIYTLSSKASDAQTAKLAKRENQSDLIAGVDLSHEDKDVANILLDLTMRDTMNQSKFFANTVVENMRARGMRILPRPHRYAGFAVLKAPDVPSVLLEIGFMSNKNEARLLTSQSYQEKVAASITDSINDYFTQIERNNR